MYFPYLRGKQFELIALREINSFIKNKNLISPIIEPVKASTGSLEKTLESLKRHDFNFNLVINPSVGDLTGKKGIKSIIDLIGPLLGDYKNYQPAIIISEKSKIDDFQDSIVSKKLVNLCLIFNGVPEEEEKLFKYMERGNVKYVVINEAIASKRFLRNIRNLGIEKVTLSDPFKVLKRNADYLLKDDEFFSDEHLYFTEDRYVGFSDFLTVGQDYTESGFLPFAVVIHLTYFNKRDELWVRHFVSDTNEDSTDVAGKFEEALNKLIKFKNEVGIKSVACKQFEELYRSGSYPGLGSIKKLSILHHIEFVFTFLNARQK